VFTGTPGKYVPLENTIKDFKGVLEVSLCGGGVCSCTVCSSVCGSMRGFPSAAACMLFSTQGFRSELAHNTPLPLSVPGRTLFNTPHTTTYPTRRASMMTCLRWPSVHLTPSFLHPIRSASKLFSYTGLQSLCQHTAC
jgi:hypothetical protein